MRKNRTRKTGIVKKAKKNEKLGLKIPENQGEWLVLAIRFTQRAIENAYSEKGYLIEQKARLESSLSQWRKENE